MFDLKVKTCFTNRAILVKTPDPLKDNHFYEPLLSF